MGQEISAIKYGGTFLFCFPRCGANPSGSRCHAGALWEAEEKLPVNSLLHSHARVAEVQGQSKNSKSSKITNVSIKMATVGNAQGDAGRNTYLLRGHKKSPNPQLVYEKQK